LVCIVCRNKANLLPGCLQSVRYADEIVVMGMSSEDGSAAYGMLVICHDRSRNIPEVLERVSRYAPAQAQSMLDQGQVFSASRMLGALAAQTDKEFFRARAWQDGVPGVLRAGILVAYKFYVWAAFWQISGARRTEADDRLVRRLGRWLGGARRVAGWGGSGVRVIKRWVGR
jgi:hypothetical protein